MRVFSGVRAGKGPSSSRNRARAAGAPALPPPSPRQHCVGLCLYGQQVGGVAGALEAAWAKLATGRAPSISSVSNRLTGKWLGCSGKDVVVVEYDGLHARHQGKHQRPGYQVGPAANQKHDEICLIKLADGLVVHE